MDNPVVIQRLVLLGLLAAPLLAALVCAWLGSTGNRGVRAWSRLFALIHLGATSLLVFLSCIELTDRGIGILNGRDRPNASFLPTSVPGDPGVKGVQDVPDNLDTQAHYTTWDLFTVQAVPSTLAGIEQPTAIQFYIGLDGLNVWLIWLTSFLTLLAIFVSEKNVTERLGAFYAWLFVLESMVIGAFASFDLVLFYVFFELTLIPTFFLIGQWGIGSGRRDAARKFFLYTLAGSLLTLTGAIGVVVNNPVPVYGQAATLTISPMAGAKLGEVAEPKSGPITFSIPVLIKNSRIWTEVHAWKLRNSQAVVDQAKAKHADAEKQAQADRSNVAKRSAADQALDNVTQVEQLHAEVAAAQRQHFGYQTLFFVLLMAGFAVKVPIVPFHTWLPAAYSEAPIGVTLLLSGVLAKLGTYGILRIVLPLSPDSAIAYGLPVFGLLGAVGIVYAAFCAYSQRDIKLLVAYSSISHLGLLILGLFAFNREGLAGATLHMVNHGLSTGAMFALLAFLIDRYRTTDSTQYGGLIARHPDYAVLMIVISLASVGLPGLNNFISEMLMISGLITPSSRVGVGYWLVIAAVSGIFLSAWYTFTMIRRVFFGPLTTPASVEGATEGLTRAEWLAFGTPAFLCLALGLYPQPILDTLQYDTAIVARLGEEARQRAGIPTEPIKERPQNPENQPTPEVGQAAIKAALPKMAGPPGGGAKAGPGGKGAGKKGAAPKVADGKAPTPEAPAKQPSGLEPAPMPKSKK